MTNPNRLRRISPKFQLDAVVPDGVPIVVEWDGMQIGHSVFIPALNHAKLRKEVATIAKQKGFTLRGFTRIEAGKYGMRFWRTS